MSLLKNKWVLVLLSIGILMFFLGQYAFNPVISFASGIFSATVGVFIVNFLDDKALGDASTFEEIVKKENLAYAIYFLGICIVVSAFYISAFLVFFTL